MAGEKYWYAVHTASRAEKKVAERLKAAGVEHYLPIRVEMREWSDRKKKVEVPAINGYVFVRIQHNQIVNIRKVPGVAFFLYEGGVPAIIPDVQIRTLRLMVDTTDSEFELLPECLEPGQTVLITRGPMNGVVGELVEVSGKHKVMVRIKHIGCATASVPRSCIEVLPAGSPASNSDQ